MSKSTEITLPNSGLYDADPLPDPDPFRIIGPNPTPEEIAASQAEYEASFVKKRAKPEPEPEREPIPESEVQALKEAAARDEEARVLIEERRAFMEARDQAEREDIERTFAALEPAVQKRALRAVLDDAIVASGPTTVVAEPEPYPIRNVHTNRHGGLDCEIDHPEHGWIPYTMPDEPVNFAEREVAAAIRRLAPK